MHTITGAGQLTALIEYLTVLLGCVDLFHFNWQGKANLWMGPARLSLSHTTAFISFWSSTFRVCWTCSAASVSVCCFWKCMLCWFSLRRSHLACTLLSEAVSYPWKMRTVNHWSTHIICDWLC